MRGLFVAGLGAFLAGSPSTAPFAWAEEPLYLRIRPNDDAAEAARARALREAVWARSDRRARIAIASVCTGCLKPLAAPVVGVEPAAAETGSISTPPPALETAGDP